jgi:KDO2-lipid IV(A) lauroyltransferase
MLLYLGWRVLSPLARIIPRRWAYRVSHALMTIVFHAWPAGRRAMRDNLGTVLDSDDAAVIDAAARQQLHRYGEYLVDAVLIDSLTPQRCHAAMPTDIWPRLREIAAREPILFALMHFGNWDVGGGAFTHSVGRSHVLVESLGHPRLDAVVQEGRNALGMTPIAIEQGALRARRALRRGGTLALLFDRPIAPHEPGIDVTFFGRHCRLPDGLGRLALASQARVIPLAIVREQPGRFRFSALVDLDFSYTRSADRSADVRALTQGVLDVHEEWIRRHPEQWYQFRPFFSNDVLFGAAASTGIGSNATPAR